MGQTSEAKATGVSILLCVCTHVIIVFVDVQYLVTCAWKELKGIPKQGQN